MVDCKDGFSGQTTTSYGVGDQSTSDSVITNWSLVIPNCLRGSGNSIIHMLPTNVRITLAKIFGPGSHLKT
jgi:hypothetical protein